MGKWNCWTLTLQVVYIFGFFSWNTPKLEKVLSQPNIFVYSFMKTSFLIDANKNKLDFVLFAVIPFIHNSFHTESCQLTDCYLET